MRRETGKWFDFSSGTGGNLISFVKRYHHISGREAFQMLCEYVGADPNEISRRRMEAVRVSKQFLPKKQDKKASKAKVLRPDHMEMYQWDEQKLSVWHDEGISYETMRKFGVRYDPVADRIVYPIKDVDGNIINVSGRTLDPDYKAKKLRKYTYYAPLGILNTLYGLSDNIDAVKQQKEIIIFEGAKSVMLADTWGIKNTAAICTSHLNPHQLMILAKLGVRTVFALDEDVCVFDDVQIKKLASLVTVEYVFDFHGLLQPKMAPVDAGPVIWQRLYNERRRY